MTTPAGEQQQNGSLDWLASWLVRNHQTEQIDIASKTVAAMLPLWKILRFGELNSTQVQWIQAVMPIVEAGYRESQYAAQRFIIDYRHARMPRAPELPALTGLPARVDPVAPAVDSVATTDTVPSKTTPIDDGYQARFDQELARIRSEIEKARTRQEPVAPRHSEPIPEMLRRSAGPRPLSAGAPVVQDTPLDKPRTAARLLGTGPGEVKRRMPAPETESMDAGQVKSAKVATSIVVDGGREVVKRAVELDAEAIGWARVLNTSPCSFCAVLASRGAVYKRDSFKISDPRFEGEGVAKVHDGCRCGLRPVYSKAEQWDSTARQLLEQWYTHTKGQPNNRAALNAFRRNFIPPEPPAAPEIDIHSMLVTRQQLLDEGFDAASDQVRWLDEQIDRFDALINLDPNSSDLYERTRARRKNEPRKDKAKPRPAPAKQQGPPKSKAADAARSHIPALEKALEDLLAQGYAPDSPQVAKARAQLARFKAALT